ncbi:ubiquitin carboxyl-terminal hydrolase MINDY-1-like [Impatiens glandulifera]|uniref:ubiquitin carboxyl-terminal hydrolase MINDY-1-like n=1 Tax=Impatiens glandulifera TaxID=253017 RepID=UPI001FB0BFEE|nr:ubiquitin carboxyl-terminal hydrolase MINDY-1-like [Impatiens glandulifera]
MESNKPTDEPEKEMLHKIKMIHFLGRSTPIILQNDNGPCPLLAICNVLLLKNNLNLSLSQDVTEVRQEQLLQLVAERLIDSNSNVNDKDAGYVENQQQNISDAIDLLHRLATGIDVNLRFRRIDDFEFTCECTIFDLLDIPLYHGWIVDPQDIDTADAIGSKSYNTLVEELVDLDDSVEVAATTAATMGVPSPSLSRETSFDNSSDPVFDHHQMRKGDKEEEEELSRVLRLSKCSEPSNDAPVSSNDGENVATGFNESTCLKKSEPSDDVLVSSHNGESVATGFNEITCLKKSETLDDIPDSSHDGDNLATGFNGSTYLKKSEPIVVQNEVSDQQEHLFTTDPIDLTNISSQVINEEIAYDGACSKADQESIVVTLPCEKTNTDTSKKECVISESSIMDTADENHTHEPNCDENVLNELTSKIGNIGIEDGEHLSEEHVGSDSSLDRRQHEVPNVIISNDVDDSKPIYEGAECILESAIAVNQIREPVYEGEAVLSEQVEKSKEDSNNGISTCKINREQGELIKSFLETNASQLTIHGLLSLQDGLKERELCVFFRNNHFNTMFKFDGELYILATDQGYINQPDLVWEKLNEVNGNSIFMTGNFKEFKIGDQSDNTWNELDVLSSTSTYLASIDPSVNADPDFNSDLQLAIALQQQEFEEQQPQTNVERRNSVTSDSRLITGPSHQVPPRSSQVTSRPEPKQSKEKCSIM